MSTEAYIKGYNEYISLKESIPWYKRPENPYNSRTNYNEYGEWNTGRNNAVDEKRWEARTKLITKTLGDNRLVIKIDIRNVDSCDKMYAGLIWETLFREVRATEFESLQSFLGDLQKFENLLDNTIHTFYWMYKTCGYTKVWSYKPFANYNDCYKICLDLEDQAIYINRQNHS